MSSEKTDFNERSVPICDQISHFTFYNYEKRKKYFYRNNTKYFSLFTFRESVQSRRKKKQQQKEYRTNS